MLRFLICLFILTVVCFSMGCSCGCNKTGPEIEAVEQPVVAAEQPAEQPATPDAAPAKSGCGCRGSK